MLGYTYVRLMADLVHNTTKHNLILSKESSYLTLAVSMYVCVDVCVDVCVRVCVCVCVCLERNTTTSPVGASQKWAKNKPTTLTQHCIIMYRIGSFISEVNLLTCSSLESKCRLPAHTYQKIQSLKE